MSNTDTFVNRRNKDGANAGNSAAGQPWYRRLSVCELFLWWHRCLAQVGRPAVPDFVGQNFRNACFSFFLSLAMLLGPAFCTNAATSNVERKTFRAASAIFSGGFYALAERDFEEFVRKYPTSDLRSEAVLLQAQSRFKQQKYPATVELLEQQKESAGRLLDEYLFWIAEANFYEGRFGAAAAAYSELLRSFPQSAKRLDSVLGEAYCRFKTREYQRVKELLGDPAGDFQKIAKDKPDSDVAVRGYMLLGETLLLQKDFKTAEQALNHLSSVKLKPELAWHRQQLLCQAYLSDQRLNEALDGAAKLMELAAASQQKPLMAEAVTMQAGILERLGRLAEALPVYEKNLTEGTPAEHRRQAVLKIIQLTYALDRTADAVEKLETFIKQFPTDTSLDLVHLTLGDFYFKRYLETHATTNATGTIPTNLLQTAQSHFEKLATDFPQSPYLAKASLNRGWCLWISGNIEDSQTWFRQAAEKLPPSEDQAVARFKYGDTLMWQKNFTNAATQYRRVVEEYGDNPKLRKELLDHTLYQWESACIEIKDIVGADAALKKILEWYPENYYSQTSMLIMGKSLKPADARELFANFVTKFPNSTLAPEAELALAYTYVKESNWTEAMKHYDGWANRQQAGNLAMKPAAEFDRAWVHYQAGNETNALKLFHQFVTQYKTHPKASEAQYWVGNYHFRHGEYEKAEACFQWTNWPSGELQFQARMMAGRAALARQSVKDARDYFVSVVNDEKCPPELVAEACFALGDVLMEEPAPQPINAATNLGKAITMFDKIIVLYATSRLVPAALGRIGDCYLQLAAQDAKYYDNAIEFYQKSVAAATDVIVRSQAEVGWGLALEKKARLKVETEREIIYQDALSHYLNVLYGKNLREGEYANPFWLLKAGTAAATLAESQRQWNSAINLYQRIKTTLPATRDLCDRKIKLAREQLDSGK
jgi:TolA-binding protein